MTNENINAQLRDDYRKQIINNDDLQYRDAISYYKQLKNTILNQMAIQSMTQYATQTIPEIEQQLEIAILEAANSTSKSEDQKDLAYTDLERIARASAFVSKELVEEIETAITNAETTLRKSPEQYKNFAKTFVAKVKEQLEISGGIKLFNQFLNSVEMKAGGMTTATAQSALSNFLMRNLISLNSPNSAIAKAIQIHKGSYANALGGYYREMAVIQGMRKYFQECKNSAASLVQVSNIAGQNRPEDIVISLFDEKKIHQILNKEVIGEAVVEENEISASLKREVMPLIGAQIKSWTLLAQEKQLSRTWFPIGHRSELATALSTNEHYLNGQDLAANMVFMGQKQHIITALGENNLMFIDGQQAYWMPEFISAFRKARLYLQLNMYLGSDKKYKISPEVALYAYQQQKLNNAIYVSTT